MVSNHHGRFRWATARLPLSSALIAAGLAAALITPAGSGAGDRTPTCHGKPATVVGTPGADRLYSEDGDFGDGDVVVLRAGRDHLADSARNVTVCGNGDHDVIYGAGLHLGARTLLDGGSGDDKVGTRPSSGFSTSSTTR
jgi:hypothetical protein